MARYDHLPIYRSAFDLAVHLEKIVRHFSRYHKYTVGTDLRECSRNALRLIITANTKRRLVERPKRREIFAADFRDRVVHHLLVGHLEPAWERRFIHDSYACRVGKGTHAAVDRVQSFLRNVTANGTRRAWYTANG